MRFSSAALFTSPLLAFIASADIIDRNASCTFSGSAGFASISHNVKSCAAVTLSSVVVPAGNTLDLSKLSNNTIVNFEGTTTWGYQEWDGPMVQIGGNNITIQGLPGALLNGDGARWWDGKGDSGKVKPKFFSAHNLVNSSINNLRIYNTPRQAVSVAGCQGLSITNMTIDNSAGDANSLGHNTDAFDIGTSSSIVIDAAAVYNQDDCVAINSGTNITFRNGLCSGGHGLSIGSVGGRSSNIVDTVTFANSTVQNSVNGIRIKTKSTATGAVKNVTYSGITLKSISGHGVLIEQNYDGGDLHGVAGTGVPITGLTLSDISGAGAVASSGYNVVITCGNGTSCADWTWSGVNVTGGKVVYGSCTNVPSITNCS